MKLPLRKCELLLSLLSYHTSGSKVRGCYKPFYVLCVIYVARLLLLPILKAPPMGVHLCIICKAFTNSNINFFNPFCSFYIIFLREDSGVEFGATKVGSFDDYVCG